MKTLLTLTILVAYWLTTIAITRMMTALGESKQAAPNRAIYISKVFSVALIGLVIIAISFVWGVDYQTILLLGSSMFAILGVAFVAQWSILANITASIIIFFSYPARIGNRIRIIDGDNSVEGRIVEIKMFHVLIEDDDRNLVSYPNNLIIQKPFLRIDHPSASLQVELDEVD